jgi:hypothetical protein
MRHDYGYVRETEGLDGDLVDVFIRPGVGLAALSQDAPQGRSGIATAG